MHRDDISENSTHLRTKESSGGSRVARGAAATMEKESKTEDDGMSRRGKHMIKMPASFVPGVNHVICAKGKEAKKHPANKKLKVLVNNSLDRYSDCPSKLERSFIVSKILATIRQGADADLDNIDNVPTDAVPSSEATPESFLKGGFVRQVKGKWYEVGDRNAREKIGQAFRDSLHTQFRSSTKAKASIRRRQDASTDVDSSSFSQSHNTPIERRRSSQLSSPSSTKRKILPTATTKTERKRPKNQPDPISSQGDFPVSEVSFGKFDSLDSQMDQPVPMPHLHLQQPLPHPDSFLSASSHTGKQQSPPTNQKDLEPLPLSEEVEASHATNGRQYLRQDSMSTIGGSHSRHDSLTSHILNGSRRSSLLQETEHARRHSLSLPQPFVNATTGINMNDLYSHMSLSAQSASSLMRGLASGRDVSASTVSTRVPRPDPPSETSYSTHIALSPQPVPSFMLGDVAMNSNPMIHMNQRNMTSSQFIAYQQFADQHNQHANIMNTMNDLHPMISMVPNANMHPHIYHNNNMGNNNGDSIMNMRTIVHDNLTRTRLMAGSHGDNTANRMHNDSIHTGDLADNLASSSGLEGNADVGDSRLQDTVDQHKQWKQQFD